MKTWEQQVAESQMQERTFRKHTVRPQKNASWLLAGFAFLAILFLWPFGLVVGFILIVIAVCIDQKRFICGACGNRVERTSTLCPACQSHLH
jgi:rubrerythrin